MCTKNLQPFLMSYRLNKCEKANAVSIHKELWALGGDCRVSPGQLVSKIIADSSACLLIVFRVQSSVFWHSCAGLDTYELC